MHRSGFFGENQDDRQGQIRPPLEISSPPEIKELAESFNTMCDRLKELDQMKIDFISHLSTNSGPR